MRCYLKNFILTQQRKKKYEHGGECTDICLNQVRKIFDACIESGQGETKEALKRCVGEKMPDFTLSGVVDTECALKQFSSCSDKLLQDDPKGQE